MRFFNTTLGISMLPDGGFKLDTLTDTQAAEFLSGDVHNAANPMHANSLQAITQKLGVNVRDAKGGRVALSSGDECLVAQISGIPRETREFTDEEIAQAQFEFRLVRVLGRTSFAGIISAVRSVLLSSRAYAILRRFGRRSS